MLFNKNNLIKCSDFGYCLWVITNRIFAEYIKSGIEEKLLLIKRVPQFLRDSFRKNLLFLLFIGVPT